MIEREGDDEELQNKSRNKIKFIHYSTHVPVENIFHFFFYFFEKDICS